MFFNAKVHLQTKINNTIPQDTTFFYPALKLLSAG